MTDRRHYILRDNHPSRKLAAAACLTAPEGYEVWIKEPTRKDIQNSKMHAMIGDIAKQVEHVGRLWDADDMKRILVDDFAEEMRKAGTPLHHDSRITPSFDGRRIVQLGIQTRDFRVKEAAQFIEYLYATGAEHAVKWSEPVGFT